MIEVIDNVLSDESFNAIREMIESENYSWCWNCETVTRGINDTPQFTHLVWDDGHDNLMFQTHEFYMLDAIRWSVFGRIEDKIEFEKYYRIKANLTYKIANPPIWHPPHKDEEVDDAYSILYYINDSDGDTFFFVDGETYTVSPKPNTAVFFKSNIKHCGSPPRLSERRLVVNMVCKTKS